MKRTKKQDPVYRPWLVPVIVSIVVAVLFVLGWWLLAGKHIAVLMPSGDIAAQQQELIIFTVLLSAIVVVPVFILLAIFAWKYRDGNGRKQSTKYDPEWKENGKLELVWWGIPIAIIAVLSVVTYITSHSLDPYRPIESENKTLKVQVVALQWKWLFIYPDYGVATVNDLTIPTDTPVHFSLSADAPMSAFWIPDLGSQIYSMNAMTSQLHLIANKQGTYKGYNTNINGKGYADMVFDVHAVSSDEFHAWHKKHAKSGHALDRHHLAELTKPSTLSAPMYMSLPDKHIYDSIIAKYMMHGGHGNHGSGTDASNSQASSEDTETDGNMDTMHGGHH